MNFVRFGLLVDNEIFNVMSFDVNHPVAEKWIAALRSDVKLVDTAGYAKIRKGYFYKDGNFFGPEDDLMTTPLTYGEKNYDERIVFAGVIDNEVIGLMSFVASETEPELYEITKAGMLSDPKYVEIPDNVTFGWKFVDGSFIAPKE